MVASFSRVPQAGLQRQAGGVGLRLLGPGLAQVVGHGVEPAGQAADLVVLLGQHARATGRPWTRRRWRRSAGAAASPRPRPAAGRRPPRRPARPPAAAAAAARRSASPPGRCSWCPGSGPGRRRCGAGGWPGRALCSGMAMAYLATGGNRRPAGASASSAASTSAVQFSSGRWSGSQDLQPERALALAGPFHPGLHRSGGGLLRASGSSPAASASASSVACRSRSRSRSRRRMLSSTVAVTVNSPAISRVITMAIRGPSFTLSSSYPDESAARAARWRCAKA